MLQGIIGIIGLFTMSLMLPFMSFLLPVFKIKRLNTLSMKKKIAANIIAMIIIGGFDYNLLFLYVGIFIPMELLYFYFENLRVYTRTFDRIMVTTIVVTTITMLLSKVLIGDFATLLEGNRESYMTMFKFSEKELNDVFSIMSKYSILIVFIYSFICNYLTYFVLKGNSYRGWTVSYKWTLLYIVTFFTTTILKFDNIYLLNILLISKIIYMAFGVKVIYSILRGKIDKFKGMAKATAVLTAITFPTGVFILGAFKSFNTKVFTPKNN